MEAPRTAFDEAITLRQAKKLIQCMAHEQSFLLLSAPGMGKSEMVYEAAREAGLPCRSPSTLARDELVAFPEPSHHDGLNQPGISDRRRKLV